MNIYNSFTDSQKKNLIKSLKNYLETKRFLIRLF
jgi:hypothetical protein